MSLVQFKEHRDDLNLKVEKPRRSDILKFKSTILIII